MKLSELCESMFAGLPSLKMSKDLGSGNMVYTALRAVDLHGDGYINAEGLQPIDLKDDKKSAKYLLREGDVVLVSRGPLIQSAIVTADVAAKKPIATANFIVLRFPSEIRAEFIVAYLNSEIGRHALSNPIITSTTSVMKSISLSGLKNMEISCPDHKTQDKIAKVFHASIEAYQATQALAEQQKATAQAQILTWLLEA